MTVFFCNGPNRTGQGGKKHLLRRVHRGLNLLDKNILSNSNGS